MNGEVIVGCGNASRSRRANATRCENGPSRLGMPRRGIGPRLLKRNGRSRLRRNQRQQRRQNQPDRNTRHQVKCRIFLGSEQEFDQLQAERGLRVSGFPVGGAMVCFGFATWQIAKLLSSGT